MSTRHKIKVKNIKNNIYYKNNPKYFLELLDIVNKHHRSLTIVLYAKGRKRQGYSWKFQYLVDWINELLPLLKNKKYKITTKIYWILNNLTDFPKCYVCGNSDFLKNKNVNGLIRGYSQHRTDGIVYCSHKCAINSKITRQQRQYTCKKRYGNKNYNNREKCKQTCIKKYGTSSNLQTSKMHIYYGKSYFYDNIKFSSQPELAFYIWLKDHNIDVVYEPDDKIYQYEFNGITHRYFPDFRVGNQLIEIKGNHLVNKDGIWIADPRSKSCVSSEKFNLLNQQMIVKQQYVLSIGVKILYYNDYKQYLQYIKNKYGKDYLKTFKQK